MRLSTSKKISAVMAGLALSMTLTAPAFAATLGGDSATKGVSTGSDSTLTINKVVVVANNEEGAASGLTVAYPAMNFHYTVSTPSSVDATVTNAEGVTAQVKPGIAGGLTTNGNIAIKSGNITLNANGMEAVNGALDFTVNTKVFEDAKAGAGIYRYIISDDTNVAALNANGVTRGAITNTTYYLDVYIKNSDDGGLVPGGYVLLDEDDPEVKPGDESKQSGFDDVPVDPVDPKDDPTPDDPSDDYKLSADATFDDLNSNDYYETFNATLTKKITGSMGDKTHAFPFAAALDNNGLGYQYTNAATLTNPTAGTAASINTTLANDGVLKVWGLSPLAKVNYTETNDTVSTYKTSIANTEATFSDEADLAANGKRTAFDELTSIVDYSTTNRSGILADANITFTNRLDQISPTGVVMRFAPYIALMAAGIVLLMVNKSRKAYEEE